jgi:hypothetical protein
MVWLVLKLTCYGKHFNLNIFNKTVQRDFINIIYMSDTLKKNKSNESLIREYLNNITAKCEEKMPVVKNPSKMLGNNLSIPTIKNYNDLIYNNYNVSQLKVFVKHYKLKTTGNKPQLLNRLYSFLYFSSYIIKIQKIFRSMLVRKYKQLHGPASLNRKLCTNSDDFISMEPIEEINFHQFISYKDFDGFIYGFDINSLHNLFLKSENEIKNPYNRNLIPESVFKNIRALIRIGKILKININLNFEDNTKDISNEKAIELRALSLFQNIDALGNYSNSNWFLSLNRTQLIKFMRELIDIWNYRAQLTNETKRNICPPAGDPFTSLRVNYIITEPNLWNVKKMILNIIEKFVNCGVDRDSKALGAYYVLGALTLANTDAATSLPWLFQSVNYF